jgi:DNA-binding HxlR family transcriptional regulator
VVGERWTLVIAHSLLGGPMRFTELKADLPGIGTNVLSDRLRKLEAAGVVRREAGDVGEGVRYRMTERGAALAPTLAEIRRWGVEELLGDVTVPRCYDLSHTLPDGLALHETYE